MNNTEGVSLKNVKIYEKRDWSPEIVEVRYDCEDLAIVVHFHEGDEDYTYPVNNIDEINEAMAEIEDRMESNRDRLPHDYAISSFLDTFRQKARSLKRLKDGTWLDDAMKALDCDIAGERDLKLLLIYSGLSARLDGKLHVYLMGESQTGKTYVTRTAGRILFPDAHYDVATMSSKAAYAMAVENPRAFEGKILLIDELKDLPEGTRATLKAMASNEVKDLTQITLDDKKKVQIKTIEGMPVIWTNSMETFDDVGNQLSNRFFKANIDESFDQTKAIDAFQKMAMSFGPMPRINEYRETAVNEIKEICSLDKVVVLNPLASSLSREMSGPRNCLPMFHSLLSAITYGHRFARIGFCCDETGKTYLLATKQDNLEAIRLYTRFAGPQSFAVPNRLISVLEALSETTELYLEEIVASVNEKKHGKPLAQETIRNYLLELSNRDLVSSRREEVTDNLGGRRQGSRYIYKRLRSLEATTVPLVALVGRDEDLHAGLDRYFDTLSDFFPQVHEDFDVEQLIDIVLKG